jgi:hypothetical protein
MADYYTVLQRAVAALPENTGAGRRAIYDKARAALVRQLETIQPPLPAAEIAKQRLSLEEAVRRIEADVARAAPPRTPPPPPPRREPPPARPEPPRAETARPDPARPEPTRPETARPEAPRPETPRPETPRAETPRPEAPRPPSPRAEAGEPVRVASPAAPVAPSVTPAPPAPRVDALRPAAPSPTDPEAAGPRRSEPVRPAPRVDVPVRGETPATAGAVASKTAPPLDAMRREEPADGVARSDAPRVALRRGGDRPADGGAPAPRLDAQRPVPPAGLVVPPLPGDENDDGGADGDDERGRSREERAARKEKRRLARLGRADEPAAEDNDAPAPEGDGEPAAESGETGEADWSGTAVDRSPLRLPPKKRRRNYGPLIAALVVLVLVGGGGALAYVYRDVLLAQVEALVAEEPAAQRRTATPAQPNGEPLVAKDEDRLPAANGQTGAAPGADPATPSGTTTDTRAVNTTRIVTPQTTPTSDPAAPANGDPAAGTAADGSAPPADVPEVAPNAEAAGMTGPSRGILYEEGETAGAKGAALNGDVKWEMVRESIGGAPPEPIVRATIAVPERQATTTIIFRRNRDDALPASHLIEVAFELPVEFPGGGISNLPGLIMKVTENARGDALIGASARVSDGLFWIALSASETDITHNLELLKDRGWIDLPMLYDNGRRAILTVEKGAAGAAAIDEAITAWAAEPAN